MNVTEYADVDPLSVLHLTILGTSSPSGAFPHAQAWQTLQSELTELSSNSQLIVADKSGHSIQLEQPQLVIDAIWEVAEAAKTNTSE